MGQASEAATEDHEGRNQGHDEAGMAERDGKKY
jgi:hypothetical protein